LRPLSLVRAKGAMPVAGDPIIARIIKWLRRAGVRRIVVNLHHRPETIAAVVGDGAQWDVGVRYSWEAQVLGSAGGPRHALPLLDAERFLIVNGDTLTDCNLAALVDRHTRSGALATMALVEGDVQRYGGACVDGDHFVRGFGKGDSATRALHFIGVQAAESAAFSCVADNKPCETVRELYPQLIAQRDRAVAAFVSDAEFLDVGTAADYLQTVATVAARENRELDRGEGGRIDPAAELAGTVIWDRVTVPADARLTNCIVADDVTVPAGARYEKCVLTGSEDGVTVTPF
jgi:NDP-sugar pyrophosphorylase family protein